MKWGLHRQRTFVVLMSCFALAGGARATAGLSGTLDPTFGGTGIVTTAFGNFNAEAYAMVIQPDGKLVLAGTCRNTGPLDTALCAMRYLPNGALDPNFQGTGQVGVSMSLNHSGHAVGLQTDGKIVLAGKCAGIVDSYFCAARFHANGALDLSFNGTGTVITGFRSAPMDANSGDAKALVVQPDGKIILAGDCRFNGQPTFCAARYLPNGALDASFNGSGKLFIHIEGTSTDGNRLTSMVVQSDGKLVLAGRCGPSADNSVFCVFRFDASGIVDEGWRVTTHTMGVGGASAYALALQPDGKLLLVGHCLGFLNRKSFCALRVNPDGYRDLTFNVTGRTITLVGTVSDEVRAVVIQPDGKILLAGICRNVDNTDDNFCALRYLPNGSLDNSFNLNGRLVTTASFSSPRIGALAVQSDGKFVIAGACITGSTSKFCALRYDGGPFGYQNCKPDVDGDGVFGATTDALIYSRIAGGLRGAAVVAGISFPAAATRTSWPLIREYLMTQCGMSLPTGGL